MILPYLFACLGDLLQDRLVGNGSLDDDFLLLKRDIVGFNAYTTPKPRQSVGSKWQTKEVATKEGRLKETAECQLKG